MEFQWVRKIPPTPPYERGKFLGVFVQALGILYQGATENRALKDPSSRRHAQEENMHHHEPEFRFCPVCGGPIRPQQLRPHEPERLVCRDCEFVYYLDPKLVACTLLEIEDRIVLLKRAIDPQKGKWVLPGGYVDRGEPLTDAAVRETREECGIITEIKALLGIYSYPGRTQVVVVYIGRPLSGELVPADETLEARVFAKRDIPWQNLAFQSTTDALKDYFKKKESCLEKR